MNKLSTLLIAGATYLAMSLTPNYAVAKDLTNPTIDHNMTLCYDVESQKSATETTAQRSLNQKAQENLADLLKEVNPKNSKEAMFSGLYIAKQDVKLIEGAYQFSGRACIEMLNNFDPYITDKILQKFQPQEKILQETFSPYIKHSSKKESVRLGNKITSKEINIAIDQTYFITNHSKPWIVALQDLLNQLHLQPHEMQKLWARINTDKDNILTRKEVKSMYQRLMSPNSDK